MIGQLSNYPELSLGTQERSMKARRGRVVGWAGLDWPLKQGLWRLAPLHLGQQMLWVPCLARRTSPMSLLAFLSFTSFPFFLIPSPSPLSKNLFEDFMKHFLVLGHLLWAAVGLQGVDCLIFLGEESVWQWDHPHELEQNRVQPSALILRGNWCLQVLLACLIQLVLILEGQMYLVLTFCI